MGRADHQPVLRVQGSRAVNRTQLRPTCLCLVDATSTSRVRSWGVPAWSASATPKLAVILSGAISFGEAPGMARPHPIGDDEGIGQSRLSEYHEEFISPESTDDVVRPARSFQLMGERDQCLVAGLMPERVVDAFEMIDVGHDQREGLPGSAKDLVLEQERLIQVSPIGHPWSGGLVRPVPRISFNVVSSATDGLASRKISTPPSTRP